MAEERMEGERSEEPSQRRIDEFRNKGEVAFSRELNSIILLAAISFCVLLSLMYTYDVLSRFTEWITNQNHTKIFTAEGYKIIADRILITFLKAIAPIFLTSFFISLLATISQVGMLYASEVLSLKWERINPVEGFKKLFSMRAIVEAAKGIGKSLILILSVYLYLKNDLGVFVDFLYFEIPGSLVFGGSFLVKLSLSIILSLAVVALMDLLYQKLSYKNRLMMTKQEAKRDLKEQDGDPLIRQRMRSIQRELTNRRTISEVKNADVVVSNPTHLSVALKYDREKMISPVVIAKGADFIALKMREEAAKYSVPVVENVPLARSLYKSVGVGETIPSSMYKIVAEVLAFVYRKKVGQG